MFQASLFRRAVTIEVRSGFSQADMVWATESLVRIEIVLAVVLPKTNLANVILATLC